MDPAHGRGVKVLGGHRRNLLFLLLGNLVLLQDGLLHERRAALARRVERPLRTVLRRGRRLGPPRRGRRQRLLLPFLNGLRGGRLLLLLLLLLLVPLLLLLMLENPGGHDERGARDGVAGFGVQGR